MGGRIEGSEADVVLGWFQVTKAVLKESLGEIGACSVILRIP